MDGQTPTQIGREGLTQKHRHTHKYSGKRCADVLMDSWMSLDTRQKDW